MARRNREEEKPPQDPKPKPNRAGKPLHVWLPDEVRAALDAAAVAQDRLLTTVVRRYLERGLIEDGHLPPSNQD